MNLDVEVRDFVRFYPYGNQTDVFINQVDLGFKATDAQIMLFAMVCVLTDHNIFRQSDCPFAQVSVCTHLK